MKCVNLLCLSVLASLATASVHGAIVRGPYLQNLTTNSIVICWRTDALEVGRVRFGTRPEAMVSSIAESTPTNEHRVQLSGLLPDTRYHYAVGNENQDLVSSADLHFATAPMKVRPVRIWVMGDTRRGLPTETSDGDTRKDVVRAFQAISQERPADFCLHTGDISDMGADIELQTSFFNIYTSTLPNTVVYAALGNHDLGTTNGQASVEAFLFPSQGEAGGVPSGSERYYSFDYADVHCVVLDNYGDHVMELGYLDPEYVAAELEWLERDLAANRKPWVIAMFHSPPYTWGSHDSDGEWDSIASRTHFVPVLERFGVDLVLTGHSHNYERSYLLKGHYGPSSTLTEAMKLNGGDGRPASGGPYYKPDRLAGTVYTVVGSSGFLGYGVRGHPAMAYSANTIGSLVIDIAGDVLQARFLRDTGAVDDHFAIIKGSLPPAPQISIQRVGNELRFTSETILGWGYQLQRSDNILRSPQPVGPTITAADTRMHWAELLADSVQAVSFYQMLMVPYYPDK